MLNVQRILVYPNTENEGNKLVISFPTILNSFMMIDHLLHANSEELRHHIPGTYL